MVISITTDYTDGFMTKGSALFFLFLLVTYTIALPEAVCREKAYDFTLKDTDGVEVSLSDFEGKYLLINFFATQCEACVIQLRYLKNLWSLLGHDISMISIGIDPVSDSDQDLINYKREHNINWAVLRDTKNVGVKYKVLVIPTLVLIDPSGNTVKVYVGITDESKILQDLPFKPPRTSKQAETLPVQGGWAYSILVTAAIAASIIVVTIMNGRKRCGGHARKNRHKKQAR